MWEAAVSGITQSDAGRGAGALRRSLLIPLGRCREDFTRAGVRERGLGGEGRGRAGGVGMAGQSGGHQRGEEGDTAPGSRLVPQGRRREDFTRAGGQGWERVRLGN